jgi:hypothetical protein
MTVKLNLPPDTERRFLAEAPATGISLDEFVRDLLLAQIQEGGKTPPADKRPSGKKSLAQLFAESPLKGLDLDFSRSRDTGRPIEL